MRTPAHLPRSSAISVVQRVTRDGQDVIEERLSDKLPAEHADLLVEWAREVSRWPRVHQRILAVDTTRRTVRLAAEGPLVFGSELAAALASLERPFPTALWLSLAQSWGKAVEAQLVPHTVAGVRGQWVVDPDQLAVTQDGRVVFGHARHDSLMDGLRLFTAAESAPLPWVRHPLQLGTGAKDFGPAAQVKDLAFSLAVLLTGRVPFDGADDAQRALALTGPMGVDGISAPIEAALRHAMHVRPEERFADVAAFLAALAEAAQVEPLAPAARVEALRAVVAEGDPAARRDQLDVATGLRPRPVTLTREAQADQHIVAALVSRLRTGVPLDEVRAAAEDLVGEQAPRRSRKAALDRRMAEAQRHYEAQLAAGLGRPTEALERALTGLNAAGVVARLGYGWSTRSGLELFGDELAELRAAGRVRGLVFCCMQTLDEAAADHDLWLTTCHLMDDASQLDEGEQAQAFLDEVQAALRAEGLHATAPERRPDQRVCELRLEGFRLWRRTGRAECVGGDPRFDPVATQRALSTPEGVCALARR